MRSSRFMLELLLLLRPVLQGTGMRRTFPDMLTVVVLGVVSGMLATAIMAGLFYALYSALLLQAFTPLEALLMTLGCAALLLVICLILLRQRLCRIKRASLPFSGNIVGMVESFLDGFLKPGGKA